MRARLAMMALALMTACGSATSAPHGPQALELPTRPFSDADELDLGESPEPKAATPIADQYRDVAKKLIDRSMASPTAWRRLEYLTDRIGHRLSGSKSLERAIDWAVAELRADGHANVRAEKVMVTHWVRGKESAKIVAPLESDMALLGLGGSPSTPRGGITAEVVAVSSFAELDKLGEEGVRGKIVLLNKVMPPYGPTGHHYGDTVVFRSKGPARVAELGGVAALVRSVTATSARSPHTGATRFKKGGKKIPAAAISLEDTEHILRLLKSGQKVKVHLEMGAKTLPDAESANVLAEIVGSEKPNEVVVIGAHIDSWDVGQGAHDDGGPCVAMMEALTAVRQLGLKPRRTLRVVLFTNEENGLGGARAYAKAHTGEKHVAAIESDNGSFKPQGFRVQGNDAALAQLTDILTLLAPIDATKALQGFSGADLIPLSQKGVTTLGLQVDTSRYFDYHHSAADTLDKVSPEHFKQGIAAAAVLGYVLADMPGELGKP